MFSRHWIWCLKWRACISACVSFWSLPKMFPTEMVFDSRARDRIGVAVQSLNDSAILQPSFDKNQTMLSVLHLTFLLCITKFVQHLRIGVCSPSSVYFALFFEIDVFYSRQGFCCLKWVACISSCLCFRSVPKRIPTEMGFEPTHGNRIRFPDQRLNHSATLSVFFDKSQKLLSVLHFCVSLHYHVCPRLSN